MFRSQRNQTFCQRSPVVVRLLKLSACALEQGRRGGKHDNHVGAEGRRHFPQTDVARFATPGVNIGLFCSTPMVALSRNVSRKGAMEMLLLGEMVSADEALGLGLVNRVVDGDRVVNEAVEFGRKIATKPVRTVKIGKEAFYRQLDMTLDEAYRYAADIMVENMLDASAVEGIGVFLGRRKPNWPR